jgi:hypothetical protein
MLDGTNATADEPDATNRRDDRGVERRRPDDCRIFPTPVGPDSMSSAPRVAQDRSMPPEIGLTGSGFGTRGQAIALAPTQLVTGEGTMSPSVCG